MNALKTLGKTLGLIAGLAPVAADAHCCCDHPRHHVSAHEDGDYRIERHAWREEQGDLTAVSNHICRNYPASAFRAHATGTTWVRIRVGGDGWVEASRISESSGRADLDRAALACVANWHFRHGYDWRAVKIAWRYHWSGWSS
jgi:TonB family protein